MPHPGSEKASPPDESLVLSSLDSIQSPLLHPRTAELSSFLCTPLRSVGSYLALALFLPPPPALPPHTSASLRAEDKAYSPRWHPAARSIGVWRRELRAASQSVLCLEPCGPVVGATHPSSLEPPGACSTGGTQGPAPEREQRAAVDDS